MRFLKLPLLTPLVLLTACAGYLEFQEEPALSGQPAWLPLGGQVSELENLPAAQEAVLAFRRRPRWFQGWAKRTGTMEPDDYVRSMSELLDIERSVLPGGIHHGPRGRRPGSIGTGGHRHGGRALIFRAPPPYPDSVSDVPVENQTVRLRLQIAPFKHPDQLLFRMFLSNRDRRVWRELEQGWTVVLPFLFAFHSDGRAIDMPAGEFQKSGGTNVITTVVEKGQTTVWTVAVDAESILALLPTRKPQTVHVTAAFSERQHVGEDYDDPIVDPNDIVRERHYVYPQVTVRSRPLAIRWTGDKWVIPEAGAAPAPPETRLTPSASSPQ